MLLSHTVRRFFLWNMILVALVILVMLAYQALQPNAYTLDTPVYWGVGRALLNGLQLYRDILEVKPPGIFLLSAASFWLLSSGYLGNLITAVFLVLFPALVAIAGSRCIPVKPSDRTDIATFLFTGTALLVTYAVVRAEYWQVELFGNMAAMTFVLVTACMPQFSRIKIFLASASLFIAIVFKEPFLLSSLGAALILAPSQTYRRTIVVPFLIAGAGFAILLLALGAFSGYINVYMQVMQQHLGSAMSLPMFARGIAAIPWMILRFTDIAPFALIAIVAWALLPMILASRSLIHVSAYGLLSIFLISALQPITYAHRHLLRDSMMQWLKLETELYVYGKALAMLATIPLGILTAIIVHRVMHRMHPGGIVHGIVFCTILILGLVGGWSATFFGIVFLAFPAIACAGILFISYALPFVQDLRLSRWDYGIACMAVFLVITSVGLAGSFWPHHFVFAVPFYFAILLLCTKAWIRSLPASTHASSGMLILPFCLLNVIAMVSIEGIFRETRVIQTEPNVRAAIAIDHILDQCGIDRYMIMSAANSRWIFQYTQHSPLNFYIFKDLNEEMDMHPLRDEAWNRFSSADLLIDAPETHKPSLHDLALTTYISSHFTVVPWACAAPFTVPKEYVLYFRNTRLSALD